MANVYSNGVVPEVVWAAISESNCSQDFLDFLSQFPETSSDYWAKAMDRAVATFSPMDPKGTQRARHYPNAFAALERLSLESNDDTIKGIACFQLGKMLQLGFGVAINRDQSINYYKKAIGLGEVRALINCGGHFDGPDASEEDLAFAHQLFAQALAKGEPMGLIRMAERMDDSHESAKYALYLQAAEYGLPYALHKIGVAHYFGEYGQKKDEALGLSWLQRAARAGAANACRLLGWHYDQDQRGRKRDSRLAFEWQVLGAALGDSVSMRVLGYSYLLGIDCDADQEQADFWLRRAAVLGDNKAQYRFGQLWITSEDTSNHSWGLAWLTLAADNGNDFAAWRAALAYRDGVGCERSIERAFKYCSIAARGGYPQAQGQLGLHYWHGNGVEKDMTQAYKWINLCALQGEAMGLYLLGLMTLRGLGCDKDEKEALRLFQAAVDKGELEAGHEIGDCHYYGIGVEKDIATAAVWYRRGAAQGHAASMTDLGYLLKEGEGVLSNPEEAFHWFLKAADLNDARAMYMLAILYAEGDGVDQSDALCRRWMGRAAMLDYRPAKEWIEQHLPRAPQWFEQLVSDAAKAQPASPTPGQFS